MLEGHPTLNNNHSAESLSSLVELMSKRASVDRFPLIANALLRAQPVLITDHGQASTYTPIRLNVINFVRASSALRLIPEPLTVALLLLWYSLRWPDAAIVTYGNQLHSYLYMIFQYALLPFRTPRRHVLFDCLWEPAGSFLRRIIVSGRRILVNNTVRCCVVYGKNDVQTFSSTLGIRRDIIRFVHYHHTVSSFVANNTDVSPAEGDYVFAGGFAGRDYCSLIAVCSRLGIPLRIATNDPRAMEESRGRTGILVRETSDDDFRRWMAGSRFVVVPYGDNIMRTGGHQTFLNAMLMGKAVILTSRESADGYLINGENGIVIEYGDSTALDREIRHLYFDHSHRTRIAKNGKEWVLGMNLCPEEWTLNVYSLALGRE